MTDQRIDNYGYRSGVASEYDEHGEHGDDGEAMGGRRPRYDGPLPEGRYRPPSWVRAIGVGLIVCMVLLLLVGVMAGAFALLAYATPPFSTTTSQTFTVSGVPTVVVQGTAGQVNVITGNQGQVAMRVTRSARAITSGLAQQMVNNMQVSVSQAGDTITIIEQDQNNIHLRLGVESRNFELDLVVPAQANLRATLNAGTLSADGLTGTANVSANAGTIDISNARLSDADLHTNAGTLTLDNVTLSGNATLGSNAGDVEMNGALAPNTSLDVHVNSGDASLTLPQATSAHLNAIATIGDVSIAGWPISVTRDITKSSASGDLAPNPSGSITIRTDVGNVTVTAR